MAFAIVAAGAVIWVYVLTVLILNLGGPLFPRGGKNIILVFLSSLLGSLYLMVFYFVSPYLAMEMGFLIILTPLSCIASGVCRRMEGLELKEYMAKTFLEALVLGCVIIALAVVRELWGFGSLSVPGGAQGIIELFRFEDSLYFPVHIISTSAGGLLLLGYGLTLFRRFRDQYGREDNQ
jgi:Na+-transporting NADH:ubiquinone oxidoreductase subunit NqrD